MATSNHTRISTTLTDMTSSPAKRRVRNGLSNDRCRLYRHTGGRRADTISIERLWRPLKYEEVYLEGYADGREACAGIAAWIAFYNGRRPNQALGNRTPMAIWREGVTGLLADNAVDRTLRLDDARASPTCPPRQQQQQT